VKITTVPPAPQEATYNIEGLTRAELEHLRVAVGDLTGTAYENLVRAYAIPVGPFRRGVVDALHHALVKAAGR
jgi:hypothetical protein